MDIDFQAIEFDSATEALQHYDASAYGDCVIALDRKYYLTHKADTNRLAAAGVSFAYVHDHEMPDGTSRIVTIPIN